jgi:photosystem II stability/assembly factor-like uncharacterized protein
MITAPGSGEFGMNEGPKTIEVRTCIIVILILGIMTLAGMYIFSKTYLSGQNFMPIVEKSEITTQKVRQSPGPSEKKQEYEKAPFVIPVETGIWRTVDPGASGGTLAHAMHPVTGTFLVTSDMTRSLLRSTDGTRTFHPIAPDGHPTLSPIVPHPGKPGIWYAGFSLDNEEGLAISDDDGETWSLINHDPHAAGWNSFGLVIDTRPETIVWDFGSKGLMISRDGGQTFTDFSQGIDPDSMYGRYEETSGRTPIISVHHNNDVIIYLDCKNGIFKRNLNDSRWEEVAGLPSKKSVSLAYDSVEKWIWAGFDDGSIYHGDVMTEKWEKVPEGLPDATILRTHPERPGWVWCFSHGRAGLFVSKDKGQTWEWLTRLLEFNSPEYRGNFPPSFRYRNKVPRDVFFIAPDDPDTLYLGQVHVSRDGGASWELGAARYLPGEQAWHGTGLTLLTSYKAWWDQVNPNRVYLGFSDTGLMVSNDRGYSIQAFWKETYPEMYSLAYWKKQMLESSGSCMAFAVDPEFPQTRYYGMSCKGDYPAVCGMLFRTDHGNHGWEPLMPGEASLPDGIITDLVIQPGNGFHHRRLYALVNWINQSGGLESGIFLSVDNGRSFSRLPGPQTSAFPFPLMSLDYCRDYPDILYMASSTRGGKRPAKRIRKSLDHSGGIFKSMDGGRSWDRKGVEHLAGAVEVAVHPGNPDIAYAAVVPGTGPDKIKSAAGIHKTVDGGDTWNLVLSADEWLPEKRKNENGEPTSVAINPELPEIVYAVVRYAGVMRSMDAGVTWERVDWDHMKKFQGNYHTLTINPHDPSEFYLSLFGNSFVAYRDPVADARLAESSRNRNLVRNGDFERTDRSGRPVHWTWNNLRHPGPQGSPILSIDNASDGHGRALRVKMAKGTFADPTFTGRGARPVTWLSNRISPYGVSLARGKQVTLSYKILSDHIKFRDYPVLSLVEITNDHHDIKTEMPAVMGYTQTPYDRIRIKPGQPESHRWIVVDSSAEISENANGLKLVLYTTHDDEPMDIMIDDIELTVDN